MGTSAGSIFVDLLLRDAKYAQGLGRNATATEKFGRQVSTSFKQVGASIAASLTLGAFVSLTKSTIEMASQIQDVSERLGLTTTELQRYSAAANLAGVDSALFESAITKLNSKIAAGEIGYKTTSGAIQDIADRVAAAKTNIEAASIANDAFGAKLGAKLLPYLKQGSAGIKALGDEAERLGVVIDEDTIRKTEQLGDQLDFLGKVIKGNFAQGFLSGFIDDSQKLKDVYSDPAFAQGIKDVGRALGDFVAWILRHLPEATTVLATFAGAASGAAIGGAAGSVVPVIGTGVGAAGGAIVGGVTAFGAAANKTGMGDKLLRPNRNPAVIEDQEKINELLKKNAEYLQKGADIRIADHEVLGQSRKAAEEQDKYLDQIYQRNLKYLDDVQGATFEYAESVDELDTLLSKGRITQDQYTDAVARAGVKLDEAKNKGEVFAFNLEAATKRAAENIQDTLADFLFDPFEKGLDGMLKGFVDTLRQMAAQAAASGILAELFGKDGKSGPLGGIFSGLTKGITGDSADPLGSFLGKTFSGLFAEGGFIPPGGWGIAGEAGAEAIYGGRTGVTVQPMSGQGNTINIDARGADQGAVNRIYALVQGWAGPGVTEARVGDARVRGAL